MNKQYDENFHIDKIKCGENRNAGDRDGGGEKRTDSECMNKTTTKSNRIAENTN